MKKQLPAWIFLSLILFACKKESTLIETTATPELPVQKTVEYQIYKVHPYLPGGLQYDVPVNLTYQIKMRNLATGQEAVLWDSTSVRIMGEYPEKDNAVMIKKQFPVFVSKEKLVASYHMILPAPLFEARGLINELGKDNDSTIIKIEL